MAGLDPAIQQASVREPINQVIGWKYRVISS